MNDKTFLLGKDLSLEETIATATTLLDDLGLCTEAVSWLNPAPNCWSVHIQSTTCPHLYTNGKGVSRLAALARGLGEFLERLSTNFFFADYFLDESVDAMAAPFLFYPGERWFTSGTKDAIPYQDQHGTALLSDQLRTLYDPDGELTFAHLCDNNSNSAERGICALPFQNLRDGGTIYFPVSLLNNLYVSNGMAAGNSPAECSSQALSEILERYVKNIIIREGISLPDVPYSCLQNYPHLCTILDTLTEQGFSTRVKDASLGGQFPVICVLLTDYDSGGAFAAFGANCRFETAIERTLTELLQGRSLDRLRLFPPPCHDINLVADPFNLESHFIDSDGFLSWTMFQDSADYEFSPWEFTGTTEEEFARLQRLITDKGFHIYRAEYSHCGMYSCRILVPGMSEIYPIDDLLWNNKGTGALLRPHLLRLPAMNRHELCALIELLDTLDLSDDVLLSQVIGVIFDEQSSWATMRIGELKAMIYLALLQKEEAIEWCSWCLNHGALPATKKRLYRLLQTLLNFHLAGQAITDYDRSLRSFYAEEEIIFAESIVHGTSRFPGLEFAGSWQEISTEQKKLLQIYERINTAKMTTAPWKDFRSR
jgi:ribosomal protein S12 methylthiotransferase accessory factor